MDLWVVAAAAGAGYVAKYWQNLSREGEGSSESYPGDTIHRQSESRNLLQQIRDQTCPLRRLAHKPLGKDVFLDREDVSDGRLMEINQLGSDLKTGVARTSGGDGEGPANMGNYEDFNVLSLASLQPRFYGRENSQEVGDGRNGEKEFYENSGDLLPDFTDGEGSSFHRFVRSRSLRGRRPHRYSVKPLNSFESCLTSQLYGEHAKMEEYVFSSIPSPSTPTVRPLLLTDGSRLIGRASNDFRRDMQFNSGGNGTPLGAPKLPKRSVELPRKLKQNIGKGQSRRLSSSGARVSGAPFHSQGSHNGMLFLFLGITIGIMSTVVANKREVDKLNELLKQTENLVEDLHDELEMKDLLTVKEITNEDYESQEKKERPFLDGGPTAFSFKQELDETKRYDDKEPDNQKAENLESMSKIEAELEAELERLELNMKASSLETISDVVELDPDFVADVVQGELRVDTVNGQPGSPSDSDSDATGRSTNHINTENYAVSPRELSLRLHEVIQSRLETRITELETALQASQTRVHFRESERINPRRDFYIEVESSSTEESPAFVDEGNNIDQPLVINLSGEALDAYDEAYEEIFRMTKTNEETPEMMYESDHIGEEMHLFDKRMYQSQNGGENWSTSRCDSIEERWSRSSVRDKMKIWGEQTSRSQDSNEVGESEDEDDDEIGKYLIKQIVEKTKQGSPVVLNVQKMLYSMDDDQYISE